NASVYDYAFLKLMDSTNQYYPLRIGQFEDAKEGDEIYSCGYPLGISQQFISKGILSTKWIQTGVWQQSGKQDSITKKDVAWLDLTMNRGNSGGPIIKVGTTSSDDEVVGIADFILNPFAQSSDELLNYLNSLKGGSVSIDGIDFAKMTKLFASAISDNSIGVSGCISIDYLKALLIPTNH
ncbi:MAG: serine protease, partial [Ginsengibacter sp.]